MANKNNKAHIGFFMNLNNPSDRAVHQILENRPPFITKTAYIKRAIMFYKKYGGGNVELTEGGVLEPIFSGDSNKEKKITNGKKNTPKNKDLKNTSEKRVFEPNDKSEEDISETISDKENDIIVKNNSDINENVDYDAFVNGFFS